MVNQSILNEKQIQVVYQAANKQQQEKTYHPHPLGLIQRGPISYLAAMANDYSINQKVIWLLNCIMKREK